MHRRTAIVFWTAVTSAVFLLGGGFATLRRVIVGGTVGDYVALAVAALGFAVALLVAGRIVFVVARAQRAAREG